MNTENIIDTIKGNWVKTVWTIIALAFAYWVWPTPWHYDMMGGTTIRTNRFTGQIESPSSDGWK